MTQPAWEAAGPAEGPVIVFIHGTRLTRSAWGAVVQRLSDTYRCISLDLPAHGARADEEFTLDAAVAAVMSAIDDASTGPGNASEAAGSASAATGQAARRGALLVGLSLGGYVAIATAASNPDRVRGLVLAGASAEPTGLTGVGFRLFAWLISAAPERQLDALNTWLFRRRYPAEIAEPIAASGYWSRGGAVAVRTLSRTRFRERLEAYGGPILVINGGLDFVFRMGERSFLRGIPNVASEVLPWTAHLSPLDDPAAFAASVRGFADRLPT